MSYMDGPKAASDLTVTCQGKSFHVHKTFLFARSDKFASMLEEAKDDNIEIEDANPDTVEIFLGYLYESQLPRLNTEEACREEIQYKIFGLRFHFHSETCLN